MRTDQVISAAATAIAPSEPDPFAELTPDQRYIAELANKGRVRLAARAEVEGRIRGWVEWVDTSGNTLENLPIEALTELGYSVDWASFGVRLTAGKHVIIATAWPRIVRTREPEAKLYNLSGNGGTAALASAASDGGGAAVPASVGMTLSAPQISGYGDMAVPLDK